ncbi:MAG: peptidoglycan DD-metalloendopeptidase family protein [Flavobacteriales bacterium]|nr:peptidoglycan DD-metalloendopeptidase family protein [Flavobacteriales bacterium]
MFLTSLTAKTSDNEIEQARKKINENKQLLDETKFKKIETLKALNAFAQQIKIREHLIKSYSKDSAFTENEIKLAQNEIAGIIIELNKMKNDYAKVVVAQYKAQKKNNSAYFLFMANSFNDLLRRLNSLRKLADYRNLQLRLISEKRKENSQKVFELMTKKGELNAILNNQRSENEELQNNYSEYENLISKLSKDELRLREEVEKTKKQLAQLEKDIRDEIAQTTKTDPDNLISNFIKGKMPWPTTSGYVSEKFGKHKHQNLKNIMTENNGINIILGKNNEIRAIADGTVSAIIPVPGLENSVLIKHGNFYSVYANLQSVSCQPGDGIKALQKIGNASTNANGLTELHFEIWQGSTKLDPEVWLTPR